MNHFFKLPEDCISAILSLTNPAAAATSSAVSKGFKSAAESDVVWDRFLHQAQIMISSPPICASKKELFLSLSHSHILLDGGKLSFSLDRWSGDKCFMVAPKELSIAGIDNPRQWEWTIRPNSRYYRLSEVAILKSARWLDIRGKIRTIMLSPETHYAAYLVFKLVNDAYGIKLLNAVVRFVNHESESEAVKRATNVYIPSTSRLFFKNKTGPLYENCAQIRVDGWIEIQLGKFYNKGGDDGQVEARSMEIERLHDKSGLIVGGIEFRPQSYKTNSPFGRKNQLILRSAAFFQKCFYQKYFW
ncbi:F-box protein PP2-B10-like [Nicotiana sylvestris]|uniref:F-box protein PP2-B10-like n=1 Tax=Nicotiana sylvestris TaxID=4096 RepID=UPI00388CD07C